MLSWSTNALFDESISLRCGERGPWSQSINVLSSRPQHVSIFEARPEALPVYYTDEGVAVRQLPDGREERLDKDRLDRERRERKGDRRVYELAFRMKRPSNNFSYTRVVTIMPRFVLVNHSPTDLEERPSPHAEAGLTWRDPRLAPRPAPHPHPDPHPHLHLAPPLHPAPPSCR